MSGEVNGDEFVELEQLRTALKTHPGIDRSHGCADGAYDMSKGEAWKKSVFVSQNADTKPVT